MKNLSNITSKILATSFMITVCDHESTDKWSRKAREVLLKNLKVQKPPDP